MATKRSSSKGSSGRGGSKKQGTKKDLNPGETDPKSETRGRDSSDTETSLYRSRGKGVDEGEVDEDLPGLEDEEDEDEREEQIGGNR